MIIEDPKLDALEAFLRTFPITLLVRAQWGGDLVIVCDRGGYNPKVIQPAGNC